MIFFAAVSCYSYLFLSGNATNDALRYFPARSRKICGISEPTFKVIKQSGLSVPITINSTFNFKIIGP